MDKALAIDPKYKDALNGKNDALSHIGGNASNITSTGNATSFEGRTDILHLLRISQSLVVLQVEVDITNWETQPGSKRYCSGFVWVVYMYLPLGTYTSIYSS